MAKNKNLTQAKKAKNDEFYTLISDVEKELKHYKKYFEGKVVYCNCDDPEESNFWKFFELNFEEYKLKKLISTVIFLRKIIRSYDELEVKNLIHWKVFPLGSPFS